MELNSDFEVFALKPVQKRIFSVYKCCMFPRNAITACTVVQAVVKANSQSNGKGQISTPRGSKTP